MSLLCASEHYRLAREGDDESLVVARGGRSLVPDPHQAVAGALLCAGCSEQFRELVADTPAVTAWLASLLDRSSRSKTGDDHRRGKPGSAPPVDLAVMDALGQEVKGLAAWLLDKGVEPPVDLKLWAGEDEHGQVVRHPMTAGELAGLKATRRANLARWPLADTRVPVAYACPVCGNPSLWFYPPSETEAERHLVCPKCPAQGVPARHSRHTVRVSG